MWMNTSNGSSGRPASSTRTRLPGSALSRFASALPAEPPPTMTKSLCDALMATSSCGSAPADAHRQFVREAVLYRSHRAEGLFEVGPRERVQRLGGDEVIGHLAAAQLLHLVIQAQRENEAER